MSLRIEDISVLPGWAQRQIADKLQTEATARPAQREAKYHNQPTERRGVRFDSKKEARRFEELLEMERIGMISNLRLQQDFTLQEAYTTAAGERVRAIRYRADFTYYRAEADGTPIYIVEDVKSKGTQTKEYKLKRKLMLEKYGVEIQEV